MLSKNKSIMIGLGALVILLVVYLVFFDNGDTANLTAAGGGASPAELYFVNLSGELDTVAFDTAVLEDPRWNALVDIRTAIVPETPGRADPFAPISGVSTKEEE
jgi:hypothetical protein